MLPPDGSGVDKRHEGRLQHGHEAAPGCGRAAQRRLMAVLVALTVGLVWWIAAWAFGVKAFDAFLLTAFIVVCAATYQLMKPFIQTDARPRGGPEPEEQGAGLLAEEGLRGLVVLDRHGSQAGDGLGQRHQLDARAAQRGA